MTNKIPKTIYRPTLKKWLEFVLENKKNKRQVTFKVEIVEKSNTTAFINGKAVELNNPIMHYDKITCAYNKEEKDWNVYLGDIDQNYMVRKVWRNEKGNIGEISIMEPKYYKLTIERQKNNNGKWI